MKWNILPEPSQPRTNNTNQVTITSDQQQKYTCKNNIVSWKNNILTLTLNQIHVILAKSASPQKQGAFSLQILEHEQEESKKTGEKTGIITWLMGGVNKPLTLICNSNTWSSSNLYPI